MRLEGLQQLFTDKVKEYIESGYVIINAKGNRLLYSNEYRVELYKDGKVIVVVFESVFDGQDEEITVGVYLFEDNSTGQFNIEEGSIIFKEVYYDAYAVWFEKR